MSAKFKAIEDIHVTVTDRDDYDRATRTFSKSYHVRAVGWSEGDRRFHVNIAAGGIYGASFIPASGDGFCGSNSPPVLHSNPRDLNAESDHRALRFYAKSNAEKIAYVFEQAMALVPAAIAEKKARVERQQEIDAIKHARAKINEAGLRIVELLTPWINDLPTTAETLGIQAFLKTLPIEKAFSPLPEGPTE